MDDQTKLTLAAALLGGYVLGRTKKGKLALSVGTYLAGKRLGLEPRQLATEGMRMLGEIPQVAEVQDQLKGEFLEAGRKAVTAAATRGMEALADTLRDRTANLGEKDEAEPEEEYEEEEPEEEEEAAPEEDEKGPERERPQRRRSSRKPARPGRGTAARRERAPLPGARQGRRRRSHPGRSPPRRSRPRRSQPRRRSPPPGSVLPQRGRRPRGGR